MIFIEDIDIMICINTQILLVLIQNNLNILGFWILDPNKVQG